LSQKNKAYMTMTLINLRALRMSFMFLMTCLLLLAAPTHVALANDNPLYASFVMDANTGEILHQRYADKSLHPASLTKVMTLLMLFEELQAGRVSLRDRIHVSNHAASMVPSKLNIPAGGTISVEDAIYALVTKSANDVAAAIGEHIGGSESQFATMMTRRAREIGMSRTVYKNASGLHHKQQVSTARDQAKLAQYILKRHPQYYGYFSTREFTYKGHSYHNHNRLMSSYQGMDGFKTGYIGPSGFNLISSAVRNDRRLIGVVFGGRSAVSRNQHMASILDRAFGGKAPVKEMAIASNNRASSAKGAPLPARHPGYKTQVPSEKTLNQNVQFAQSADFNDMSSLGDADQQARQAIPLTMDSAQTAGSKAINTSHGQALASSQNAITPASANSSQILGQIIPSASHANSNRGDQAQMASLQPITMPHGNEAPWAIQIGAFESRARTDSALRDALTKLPTPLKKAAPYIAPLKTGDGWLFRARLGGLSKTEAIEACKHLKDCLPVAPQIQ
jgi:D-alanyl-D-alanine carboxypeptidase